MLERIKAMLVKGGVGVELLSKQRKESLVNVLASSFVSEFVNWLVDESVDES